VTASFGGYNTINRTVSMLMYGLPWPLVFRFQSLIDAPRPGLRPSEQGARSPQRFAASVFRFRIIHFICENARFFCAGAPVLGLINEVANHSCPRPPSSQAEEAHVRECRYS